MCGRYRAPGEPAGAHHKTDPHRVFRGLELPGFENYNAAPTQRLPVVRIGRDGRPEAVLLRWGLVPSWADDPKIGSRLINARGETVAEKPAFRSAFRRRRCLVPMRGFYEWQARTTPEGRPAKLPHYIHLPDVPVFAAAGLHETWRSPDGEEVQTYAIVTTGPNGVTESVHDRMPAILDDAAAGVWLDPRSPAAELLPLLEPYPAERMAKYPVSSRVNSVRNNDERLIEPLGLPLEPPAPHE
jgi:putative SOS response-associated peptidase YedK